MKITNNNGLKSIALNWVKIIRKYINIQTNLSFMKTLNIILLLLVAILFTGCIRWSHPTEPIPTTNNTTTTQEPIVNVSTEDKNNSTESKDNNTVPVETPVVKPVKEILNCPFEIHAAAIHMDMSNNRDGYAFRDAINEFGFSNQGDGKLYIFITDLKTKNIKTLTLPTGIFAPQNAIKINELYAIKIINRTYERIDNSDAKEILNFEIYNLSDNCTAPEYETKPQVTLDCGLRGYGDCIGSKYYDYSIQLSALNTKGYSKFDLSLSIDGGDALLPFSKDQHVDGNAYMRYEIPAGTFSPGTHIMTVELETDDGIIYKENYNLLILSDDKIAFRKYTRADLCANNDVDFISYFNDTPDGIVIRHNYYSNKLTLAPNGCVTSQTGFAICDNNEQFSGTYDYKILNLQNAKSWCVPEALNLPDTCKTTEIVQLGDSFKNNYGEEYKLVKIYDEPKLVAFEDVKKNWITYYPYNPSFAFTQPIQIQSVTSNSATIIHTDVFCDVKS